MKRIAFVFCIAVLGLLVALTIGLSRPGGGKQYTLKVGTNLVSIVAGTNVTRIIPGVTRGYQQPFYWPNRLAWTADQVCRTLPFLKLSIPSGKEVARREGTVVWLQCNYPTNRPIPSSVMVSQLNSGGHIRIPPGGFVYRISGRRTVLHMVLDRELGVHRGVTYHVEDRATGEELATVQIQ